MRPARAHGRCARLLALALAVALPAAAVAYPARVAAASKDTSDDVKRIAGELGGSILGAAAAVVVLTFGLFVVMDDGLTGNVFADLPVVMLLVGATLMLASLGTWGGGELAGGNSSYWLTTIGMVTGATFATALFAFTDIDMGWAMLAYAVLGIGGAILAYELANEPDESELAGQRLGVLLAPRPVDGAFVAAVPGGGVAGFSLSF